MSARLETARAPEPRLSPYLSRNIEAHLARWHIDLPTDACGRADVELVSRLTSGSGLTRGWPDHALLRARLRDSHGALVQVHSDRDPWAEAAAWLGDTGAHDAAPQTLVVVGAGLGFVIDMVEQCSQISVLVLEPEPDLVPWLLARRDWTPLIESGRLLIVPGPSYDAAAQAWAIFRRTHRQTPRVLTHPVIARVRPDAAAAAATAMTTALQGARANGLARRRFEAPYLLNTLANVPRLCDAPALATLAGLATDRPVVIAGAGPSLNRNIEQLRPFREDVVLLATDTAVTPLTAARLMPDFVVAVDPGPLNARHLAHVDVPPHTTLVAEASIDPASFAPFAHTVFFRVADHAPWPWLTRVGIDVGRLRAWGSVLTSAFDLALHLGADPIVFIGADLAFTGDQTYCRGTVYEADWQAEATGEGIDLHGVWARLIARQAVMATDLAGLPVKTAPHLIAYRDWLARAAHDAVPERGSSPSRVVNATGAGILYGDSIAQQSLADALGTYRASSPARVIVPPAPRYAPLHAREPIDDHLLTHAMRRPVPHLAGAPRSTGVATPYMRQSRRERVRETRLLRLSRSSDAGRWKEADNLDPAWERRAIAAADLIPPGASVLDLGAGRETLSRHLPTGGTYTPADLVARSPRTVVVDVNAGEFPAGTYDVVTTLGLLEYVHDLPALLSTATTRARLLVASYCVLKSGSRESRLQRGWMNDLVLADLMDLFVETGWNVASATRLDEFEEFDQWLFACRPSARVPARGSAAQQASSRASDALARAD